MRLARYGVCLGLLSAGGAIAPAVAADVAPVPVTLAPAAGSFLSEIRGGVLAHNPAGRENGSVDVNLEVLFVKPFQPIDPVMALFVPRVHLGTTVNTAGGTSAVYAGFAWTYDVTDRLFGEITFGAGFHNGKTGNRVPRDRIPLGCSPLFRESASLGYRIDAHWSVMGTVEHMSNAGLCKDNPGITNYGIRVGYTF